MIPLVDLQAQYGGIRTAVNGAIHRVLESAALKASTTARPSRHVS